jgi:phenylacetic acid degradation operon negative regulatory protein
MHGAIAEVIDASPSPTLSRHHAAGAASARGLLFTILGEYVLPAGGSAWTSTFVELLRRLGVEQKAARQALMRTSSDGWLATERVGRRTCWQLTPAAIALLTEGTERIYGFTATQHDWDGRWIVVLARVSERDRAARHLMRTRLERVGFGSVSPGVWLSTHAERRHEAEQLLDEAGVLAEALVIDGEVIAGQPLNTLVSQAWDLKAIEADYREFIREFRSSSTADPLVRLTALVHGWRRFPWVDPGLPTALLPPRWQGIRAANLFADRHARWVRGARSAWDALEATSTL